MAPTKHTTTGLLVNVAKSSVVRDTSTKLGMTKKELPKKVKWLQRHWVTKGVVRGPTFRKEGKEEKNTATNQTLRLTFKNILMKSLWIFDPPCSHLHSKMIQFHSSICTEQQWKLLWRWHWWIWCLAPQWALKQGSALQHLLFCLWDSAPRCIFPLC